MHSYPFQTPLIEACCLDVIVTHGTSKSSLKTSSYRDRFQKTDQKTFHLMEGTPGRVAEMTQSNIINDGLGAFSFGNERGGT